MKDLKERIKKLQLDIRELKEAYVKLESKGIFEYARYIAVRSGNYEDKIFTFQQKDLTIEYAQSSISRGIEIRCNETKVYQGEKSKMPPYGVTIKVYTPGSWENILNEWYGSVIAGVEKEKVKNPKKG